MRDFIKEMEVEIENGNFRLFKWINIDDQYNLSIQASGYSYSTPRKNIDLEEYSNFEVAIIKNGKFLTDKSILNDFDKYDELMEYKMDTQVFGYVPKKLVNDLYWYMIEKF